MADTAERIINVRPIKQVDEFGRYTLRAWVPEIDWLSPELVLAAKNAEEAEVEAGWYLQLLCEKLADMAGLDRQKDVHYE